MTTPLYEEMHFLFEGNPCAKDQREIRANVNTKNKRNKKVIGETTAFILWMG